jgi:outer membrane protein OmpA-like peptidoglycan-associated protein/tetratricopeptide (TPR) repeat protein
MIKKYVLFTIFSVFCLGLIAQIYIEENAIYDEAEEYLEGEEFEEALALFHLLEKRQIVNSNISYKIGLCYLHIEGQKSRSIPYLQNAVQNITNSYLGGFEEFNAPVKAWLLLGQAYHNESDLENARTCFKKVPEVSQDSDLIKLSEFYLSRIYVAEIFLKNPVHVKSKTLNDNFDFSIYNPHVISDSEMILMERRKFYDALITCKLDSNSLINNSNITPMIGSDGNIFLCGGSTNGKLLIYTAYNAGKGYDLYYSEKLKNNNWSKYKRFPEPINSSFNESSATLSGNTLYFTSNRKGTLGGEDIFVSIMDENGDWSEPKNLGSSVNSIFDESCPIPSNNNSTLFFCSQGHLNMGGFDFFYSQRTDNGEWLPAINMGSPFSTTADERFYSKEAKGNVFYTTRYDLQDDEASKITRINLLGSLPPKKMIIKGKLDFPDSLIAKPVNFTVRNPENIESTWKTSSEGHYSLFLEPGNYSLKYKYNSKVTAEQSIYIEENQVADELILSPPIWKFNDSELSLNQDSFEKSNLGVTVYITDILFDFNSTKINERYFSMLDSLIHILKRNKENQLLITGHTDAVGNDGYNLELSRSRAKIVFDYFQKNNVNMQQVTYEGVGETNPVALNFQVNGKDNPEGRKYNRRVELKFSSTQQDLQVIRMRLISSSLMLE